VSTNKFPGMAELEINGPECAREHIYRRHQRPAFRCPRCLDTFETDDKLNEHARSDAICDTKDAPPEEETIYISKSQESELRKKKRERSEEERWFNIFNICFPGVPVDQRPSPCKQIHKKMVLDTRYTTRLFAPYPVFPKTFPSALEAFSGLIAVEAIFEPSSMQSGCVLGNGPPAHGAMAQVRCK
jgi:hypothetical protein